LNKLHIKCSWEEIVSVLNQHELVEWERHFDNKKSSWNLTTNTSEVQSGDIFLAYRGVSADAHRFIPAALSAGASAVIIENTDYLPNIPESLSVIVVKDGRKAWAVLSAESFLNPQERLKMLAVTGTNGKTSTTWFISQCLNAFAKKCLSIGTLGARIGDEYFPTIHTTPDPPQLYGLISYALDRHAQFCVMEAASQSLLHHKLDLIGFDAAIFTSFSRDHLDLHQSMEEYFSAKWVLFDRLLKSKTDSLALINSSIAPWLNRDRVLPNNLFWYGIGALPGKGYRIEIVERSMNGAAIKIFSPDNLIVSAQIPLLGDHLVENFCAAAIVCSVILDKKLSEIFALKLASVPGRGEVFRSCSSDAAPTVIVDYAHTPDALEKALVSLRHYASGKLIVVFGCGGDRDKGKRPLMGKIAAALADRVFVTSDNPRTEDPEKIMDEILAGFPTSEHVSVEKIADRSKAIQEAIFQSTNSDLVLIAGKGHEDYQVIGNQKIPFDDRKLVQEYLDGWSKQSTEL
jgi:UDP-N-acetylmuramoyl-L-alanyl-D-glutamate--2,6-diaminopimelate ligase